MSLRHSGRAQPSVPCKGGDATDFKCYAPARHGAHARQTEAAKQARCLGAVAAPPDQNGPGSQGRNSTGRQRTEMTPGRGLAGCQAGARSTYGGNFRSSDGGCEAQVCFRSAAVHRERGSGGAAWRAGHGVRHPLELSDYGHHGGAAPGVWGPAAGCKLGKGPGRARREARAHALSNALCDGKLVEACRHGRKQRVGAGGL